MALSKLTKPRSSLVVNSDGTTVQDTVSTLTFKSLSEALSYDYSDLPVFIKIIWQGYYIQSDGGSNWGVLKKGDHTHDGGSIFSIDSNTYIEANMKGKTLHASKFGVVADGVVDDTERLQVSLDYLGGSDYSSAFNSKGGGILRLPSSTIRITDTIRHPEWVTVVGSQKGAISGMYKEPSETKGSIVYADFTDTRKTAWSIAGKWLRGDKEGEWINLVTDTIGANEYDGGNTTRQYGCSVKDITFITDKEVCIGIGFAGAPSLRLEVSCHGFLHSIVGHSSWGLELTANSRGGHTSLFLYNTKGCTVKGYYSVTTVSTTLDEDTVIAGWYPENALHNPSDIRFLTTCIYSRYTSAIDFSVVMEGHQRAVFEANTYGNTYVAPYIEQIKELPVHMVGSYIQMTKGRIYLPNIKFGRVSSFGNLDVDVGAAVVESWDYGSLSQYGAKAQMRLRGLTDFSEIPETERYNGAVSFETTRDEDKIVHVSSSGDDAYTGLSEVNSVKTLSRALELAEVYRCDSVKIKDGSSVELGDSSVVTRDVTIYSEGGASLNCDGDLIIAPVSCRVKLKNISVSVLSGASQSFMGLLKPEGNCSFDFSDVDITGDASSGIFVNKSNSASLISVNFLSSSLSGSTNLGREDYSKTGSSVVILQKDASTNLSSDTFTLGYRVL